MKVNSCVLKCEILKCKFLCNLHVLHVAVVTGLSVTVVKPTREYWKVP